MLHAAHDVGLEDESCAGGAHSINRTILTYGAALVLGIAKGYADPTDFEAKKAHYRLVQEFARRFREQNGSIVCRELLSGVEATSGGDPEARTPEYYRKRPCPNLAWHAARILDEML